VSGPYSLLEDHLAGGRLDQAESVARHLLQKDAEDLVARSGLARIEAARGRVDDARAELETLMAENPHAPEPAGYLAVLAEAAGNHEEAFAFAERSLSLGGQIPAVLAMVADRSLDEGDQSRARFLYDRALKITPELSRAWLGMARILAFEGALADAEDAYVNAVTHGPQIVEAWTEMIALEYDAGAEEVARENLAVALRTHPGHPDLVALAARMGAAGQDDPFSQALEELRGYLYTDDFAGGTLVLDRMVQMSPHEPRLAVARGEMAIAMEEGDFPTLIHQLNRMVRIDPNDWEIKNVLGRLLLRPSALQNPRMGAAHCEDAWRISGEHPSAGLGLVEAWAAIGKTALARALCMRLAEVDHPVARIAQLILEPDVEPELFGDEDEDEEGTVTKTVQS
jgi:tetratricopeptide (TPR) repeat protein